VNPVLPSSTWLRNQEEFGKAMHFKMAPVFAGFGLTLDSLVVQNVSLPEELQKILDQKIGMNMIGDMGRFTQYQVANAIPLKRHRTKGAWPGWGLAWGRRRLRSGDGAGDGLGHATRCRAASCTGVAAPAAARRFRPTRSWQRWKSCMGWLKKAF
jgi:membrane protease subunit (stomatin/prohibitin family)